MADLQCPSCGKTNPADFEQCSYCGTRLKTGMPSTTPLDPIKPGQMPTKKPTSELESTLPSWLREARQGTDDQATRPIPSVSIKRPSSQPAQDDFLAGLQGAGSERPTESGKPTRVSMSAPKPPEDFLAGLNQASSEDEEEVPDWLAGIRGKVQQDGKSPLAQQPAVEPLAEDSDWLSNIFGETAPAEKGPEPQPLDQFQFDAPATAPEPVTSQAGESLDWLSGLGDTGSTPSVAESKPSEELSDFSSWLSNLEQPAAPSSAAEPAAPAAGSSDWLASFDTGSSIPAESTPAVQGDLPDWLSNLDDGSKPAEPVVPSAESSDWLSSFNAGSSVPAESIPAVQGDLPDWLSSLNAGSKPAEPVTPAAGSSDWLSSFDTGSSAPAKSTPAAQGDLPDWLSSIDAGSKPVAPESPATETPDWMSGIDTGTKTSEQPPAIPLTSTFNTGSLSAFAEDMPDWMSSLGVAPSASEPKESAPKAKPFEADTLPSFDLGSTPDWLASVGASNAASEVVFDTPLEPIEIPAASTAPEAPSDLFSNVPASDTAFSMEVPDWLSGFTPSETEKTPVKEKAEEDIAPVELPSWVQAMRPVESVISEPSQGEEDTVTEQQGPLAGFRNLLPVNPGLLPARKPQSYGIKLDVSPVQQNQSALLEQLIAGESKPKAFSPRTEVLSLRALRWGIAGTLIVIALIVSLLGFQLIPTPLLVSSDTISFIDQLNALPDSAPVLLAIDYDPGFAAELEAASSPVLDYLMLRGARLVFISTSPTGSYLADRAVSLMPHSYESGTNYANFGYLPGGSAGVNLFAIDPLSAVQVDVERNDAWMLFPDIQHLNDFAAVIILTDNAETGRMWIEQTGSALHGKPMLMVISAQAEPMLRPYYDSGQVQGMITGLSGGTYYEETLQHMGRANQYWNTYGITLLVSALMIILGGLWNLFTGLNSRRSQEAE